MSSSARRIGMRAASVRYSQRSAQFSEIARQVYERSDEAGEEKQSAQPLAGNARKSRVIVLAPNRSARNQRVVINEIVRRAVEKQPEKGNSRKCQDAGVL